MEKGVSGDGEREQLLAQLRLRGEPDGVDIPAGGLAHRRGNLAEALEVVLPHQAARSLLHSRNVERGAMPPGVLPAEQGTRLTRPDAIGIGARAGVEACRETRRGMEDLPRRHVIGKQGRKRAHPARAGYREFIGRERHAHILRPRMHAGIRPAGAGQIDGTPEEGLECPARLTGDRPLTGLLGKTGEPGPVVGKAQHERAVEGVYGLRGHGTS